MIKENKSSESRYLALTAIILGWALCAYFILRYTQLKNHAASTSDLCRLIFGSGCDEMLLNGIAWHLGYPLAYWGFCYFGLVGVLISFQKSILDKLSIFLSAFGVGVSAFLSFMIARGSLTCPLCLVIHFLNLLSFILLVSSLQLRGHQRRANLRQSSVRWTLLLLPAVLAGGFTEVGILKTAAGKAVDADVNAVAEALQKEKVNNFPQNDSSPHLGSPKAAIQIVVFSSFQCPACQNFAPSLESLHDKYGNKIGITFKNFPLSTSCNPRLSQDMQPHACAAATAAMAAHLQNRFWNYHDRLFESGLVDDEKTLTAIAKDLKLDMEKWEKDRHSEEVMKLISSDINAGYQTSMTGTPSVFFNGRQVSHFQENVLDFLIKQELKKPHSPASLF